MRTAMEFAPKFRVLDRLHEKHLKQRRAMLELMLHPSHSC